MSKSNLARAQPHSEPEKQPLTNIEYMHELAKNRNGRCLSSEYLGTNTKLTWQCGQNHVWESTPTAIKSGKWCPTCGGTKAKTIEDMHKLAENQGGKCHSTFYQNSYTKLDWECAQGHTFNRNYTQVAQRIAKNAEWCPHCIEDARPKGKPYVPVRSAADVFELPYKRQTQKGAKDKTTAPIMRKDTVIKFTVVKSYGMDEDGTPQHVYTCQFGHQQTDIKTPTTCVLCEEKRRNAPP